MERLFERPPEHIKISFYCVTCFHIHYFYFFTYIRTILKLHLIRFKYKVDEKWFINTSKPDNLKNCLKNEKQRDIAPHSEFK